MGITKILAEAQNLWMKINLQGAVLTSLSLQVFLIFFEPMRKRWSNRWIRTLMWLAYLVADSVAIYDFGLIAKAQINGGTSDSEVDAYGDLLAFWAPFLLLHLGGPDTITAFALEDHELWRRHLLNLLFQLGTACYVFYQSLPNNKLIVPTILLFVGGTIKYIERTYALYLASFSNFRGSLLSSVNARWDITGARWADTAPREMMPGPISESQYVIIAAFSFFTAFKGLLVDLPINADIIPNRKFFERNTAKDAIRVIEAQLNFFYDVLYTKAAVLHCRLGYLFRAISIGSVVTAFALFYTLKKHGFHEYDTRITYTLLLGAVGLEFVALSMLICSDMTFAKIGTSERHGSIFIKFLHIFKSESSPFTLHILSARWSKSICQYNLIDSRLRRWPKWIEKLLDLIFFQDTFDDLKPQQPVLYSEELGELIFYEVKRMDVVAMKVGQRMDISKWALEHSKTGQDCTNLPPFINDLEYDESLLLWHIATELCYSVNTDDSTNFNPDRENSKVLSDYMLHLMIKQPNLMSTVAGFGEIRFRFTSHKLDEFLNKNFSDGSKIDKAKKSVCGSLLSTDLKEVPNAMVPKPIKLCFLKCEISLKNC